MKRIAAIVGDYYHNGDWAKESLNRALSASTYQLEFYSHEQLKEVLAATPSAIILFKENRLDPTDKANTDWMTEDIMSVVTNYVEKGGGWLAWHSGLASYPTNSPYTEMLKGHFLQHPEKHQLVTYQATTENEPVINTDPFEILDEHYFVQVDTKNTSIFLTSSSIDGHQPAGWAHTYGDGRVCCLTPAHIKEGLLNKDFLILLEKCINWTAENK